MVSNRKRSQDSLTHAMNSQDSRVAAAERKLANLRQEALSSKSTAAVLAERVMVAQAQAMVATQRLDSVTAGADVGSVVAGTALGTTPPAVIQDPLSTDRAGRITFGTGTATAAHGGMLNINFTSAFVNPPVVTLTARNAATQGLGLFISSTSSAGFWIGCTTPPTASQANTFYALDYVVTAL